MLLILAACSNEDKTTNGNGNVSIQFKSKVEDFNTTDASHSPWEAGDEVGIYMYQYGKPLSGATIVNDIINTPFVTLTEDGFFQPLNGEKRYPEGRTVNFIAYYPQCELSNRFSYPININDQTEPDAIDFLYSNNLQGITGQQNDQELLFKHQLSKLTITTNAKNGVVHPLQVKVSNVFGKGNFKLALGEMEVDKSSLTTLTLNTVNQQSSAVSTGLLLPVDNSVTLKVTLTYNAKSYNKEFTVSKIEAGKSYAFSINLDDLDTDEPIYPEIPSSNYRGWMETPLITEDMLNDKNLMYVIHEMPNMTDTWTKGKLRNYSLLYDKDLKFAYWVAYPLFKDCIGSSGRTDAWNYDPAIPSSSQANLSSGFGNQYDRGHQIPSGDRTCDKATNRSTFYYSNMTPQVGQKMNQYIWNQLENKVRAWVNDTDTVFVVTGAMPPKTGTIERQKGMAVPAYYFKALARKRKGDSEYTTIAFKLENRNYSNTDYMQSAMSVKELEDITGFTFFTKINTTVKATLDKNKWN